MTIRLGVFVLACAASLLSATTAAGQGTPALLDLSRATVVTPADLSGPERKAVQMLVEEVERRSQVRWPVATTWPAETQSVVAVGPWKTRSSWLGPHLAALATAPDSIGAEGFTIASLPGGASVAVAGYDSRGVLFGVGRLLRELRLTAGRVALPGGFQITTAPQVALRGHQLGYRPKTNSYDAWDLPEWERYIRDLAVFGTNAVELLPPRTDDDADSPHFPRRPLEMMVGMSRILDEYGLDVWIWYPAMDADYNDPSTVARALEEWSGVFSALPRIDAVFVPGGDPGHTQPKVLMAFLEKVSTALRKAHPRAQMWVSPQGFTQLWMNEFLGILATEPQWLHGIVYGPQVRGTMAELRKAVPARYPIRSYPDITHSRQCQYPVPDWDLAFAVTEGREVINPRPLAMAAIFEATRRDCAGFLTYSEGCNDDVNKIVWSALGWDPNTEVVEILRQYSRYFIGEPYTEGFAQALLALERNWHGPLLSNSSVETTLRQLQNLERTARPAVLRNWRVQQALYRAYYDAYVRDRLLHETAVEAEATARLRSAGVMGTRQAIESARSILADFERLRVSSDRRARVFELGEALFQSIQMQLSVGRYKAIAAERGANLDTIDTPLNNRVWLDAQLTAVAALATEPERQKSLDALLKRADPGPGGFYDDLGDPSNSPHLVREPGSLAADPLSGRGAFHGFALRPEWPLAWRNYAQTFYDHPLTMRYEGLDPTSKYRVRFTYSGDSPSAKMRLVAEGTEVHPWITKPNPVNPIEFDVPAPAVADGALTLTWTQEPGRGGNGRGCQVAEVWLIRAGP
jgi:hypothetical protein